MVRIWFLDLDWLGVRLVVNLGFIFFIRERGI